MGPEYLLRISIMPGVQRMIWMTEQTAMYFVLQRAIKPYHPSFKYTIFMFL